MNKGLSKILSVVYVCLMFTLYLVFVAIERYRIVQGKQRDPDNISLEDVEEIAQFNEWTSIIELLFLGVFIVVSLFLLTKAFDLFGKFLLINGLLLFFIYIVSYPLSNFIELPVMNLTQITFIPITFLFFFSFLFGIKHLYRRLFRQNKG